MQNASNLQLSFLKHISFLFQKGMLDCGQHL